MIEEINVSDSGDLLKALIDYLSFENKSQKFYILTEPQKVAISESRMQIKAEDYFTNAESDQKVDEWLKK